MSLDPTQFRMFIIRAPLQAHNLGPSQAAEELLLMTAAQETHLGRWVKQEGGGPAVGVYQMEPATFRDNLAWARGNFVTKAIFTDYDDPEMMVWHWDFATVMARVHYLRVREALPAWDDRKGLAEYYKKYWNTYLGKATVPEAMANYERYVIKG